MENILYVALVFAVTSVGVLALTAAVYLLARSRRGAK